MRYPLHLPSTTRLTAGATAGVIGGLAHAVMNEIDLRAFNHNADDMLMLGGTLSDDRDIARRIGFGMHLGISALFGAAYAAVLKPHDERDALAKAVGLAMVENVGLYPLVFPLERFHPYIRTGRLDRFAHPKAFAQATLRHVALGIGLGLAYSRVARCLG